MLMHEKPCLIPILTPVISNIDNSNLIQTKQRAILVTFAIAISRVDRKTVASQMVVFPNTQSPHHEGVMKITTFLSVNNENLGALLL